MRAHRRRGALALTFSTLAVACSRGAPTPITTAPVASASAIAAPSTPGAPLSTVSIASVPSSTAPASSDFARGCPVDPDPALNASFYGHGVARFVTPDGKMHDFQVEIAKSEPSQARGMMYRTQLAADAGMVFDFPEVHHAIFWMHHTCVPLDMIFIDEDRRVIGVVTAPRLNDDPREVPGWSRYVVEVGAGVARAHGIGLGTRFVPPSP